jgi:hypothetical protein
MLYLALLDEIYFQVRHLLGITKSGKTFHHKRAARLGDPLPPLLFVLVADFLQSLINKDCQYHVLLTAPF